MLNWGLRSCSDHRTKGFQTKQRQPAAVRFFKVNQKNRFLDQDSIMRTCVSERYSPSTAPMGFDNLAENSMWVSQRVLSKSSTCTDFNTWKKRSILVTFWTTGRSWQFFAEFRSEECKSEIHTHIWIYPYWIIKNECYIQRNLAQKKNALTLTSSGSKLRVRCVASTWTTWVPKMSSRDVQHIFKKCRQLSGIWNIQWHAVVLCAISILNCVNLSQLLEICKTIWTKTAPLELKKQCPWFLATNICVSSTALSARPPRPWIPPLPWRCRWRFALPPRTSGPFGPREWRPGSPAERNVELVTKAASSTGRSRNLSRCSGLTYQMFKGFIVKWMERTTTKKTAVKRLFGFFGHQIDLGDSDQNGLKSLGVWDPLNPSDSSVICPTWFHPVAGEENCTVQNSQDVWLVRCFPTASCEQHFPCFRSRGAKDPSKRKRESLWKPLDQKKQKKKGKKTSTYKNKSDFWKVFVSKKFKFKGYILKLVIFDFFKTKSFWSKNFKTSLFKIRHFWSKKVGVSPASGRGHRLHHPLVHRPFLTGRAAAVMTLLWNCHEKNGNVT